MRQEENIASVEQQIHASVAENLNSKEISNKFARDAMNYQILLRLEYKFIY